LPVTKGLIVPARRDPVVTFLRSWLLFVAIKRQTADEPTGTSDLPSHPAVAGIPIGLMSSFYDDWMTAR